MGNVLSTRQATVHSCRRVTDGLCRHNLAPASPAWKIMCNYKNSQNGFRTTHCNEGDPWVLSYHAKLCHGKRNRSTTHASKATKQDTQSLHENANASNEPPGKTVSSTCGNTAAHICTYHHAGIHPQGLPRIRKEYDGDDFALRSPPLVDFSTLNMHRYQQRCCRAKAQRGHAQPTRYPEHLHGWFSTKWTRWRLGILP